MTIPMVPFEGRMSYCLTRSLAMVLAHRGYAYPVPWLECVSGEPFGFAYIRDQQQFFAIDGYVYHEAGQHLLRTLNFTFSFTGSEDEASALEALQQALADGPVAVGMLDMGYLTYFPDHESMRGADHAIVVLALQSNQVIVHDPAGFVAVPLPLADFLASWQRDVYTRVPYGLWRIGAQGEPPTEEAIWQRTLARARENLARTTETLPDGTRICYGPEGMRLLAADLRAATAPQLGSLPYFNWRVSAQRCLDSAFYLRDRLPDAAAIRWEECQMYGMLQQASASHNLAVLPELLERLAEQEARFIVALGERDEEKAQDL
jgi:hypothetical protein